jgi:hypothetical protein
VLLDCAAGRRLFAQLTCSGAAVRVSARRRSQLSYAQPFAFSMSSLDIDYSPRIVWRLERNGHVMEARLMPHAQHVAVVILLDGQLRAAEAFEHQTDALRWAEEQRRNQRSRLASNQLGYKRC